MKQTLRDRIFETNSSSMISVVYGKRMDCYDINLSELELDIKTIEIDDFEEFYTIQDILNFMYSLACVADREAWEKTHPYKDPEHWKTVYRFNGNTYFTEEELIAEHGDDVLDEDGDLIIDDEPIPTKHRDQLKKLLPKCNFGIYHYVDEDMLTGGYDLFNNMIKDLKNIVDKGTIKRDNWA